MRLRACSESCLTPCQTEFRDMPGRAHKRRWSGDWVCIAAAVQQGWTIDTRGPTREIFDWQLDHHAAFEVNALTNRYGLNQHDIIVGMVPWLIACQRDGLMSDLNGNAMDWSSPEFWDVFLHALAYGDGAGAVLTKGGWQAAQELDMGLDHARRRYPGWGHASHWDGRMGAGLYFPFWVSSALQWLVDTRDPFSTGHGSLRCCTFCGQMTRAETEGERAALLAAARAFGRLTYGTEAAADPYSGYEGKARVGYFHTIRRVIKDCVPVDDHIFPLLLNGATPPERVMLRDSSGRDIEGKDAEAHLFRLGTGTEWSRDSCLSMNVEKARTCSSLPQSITTSSRGLGHT